MVQSPLKWVSLISHILELDIVNLGTQRFAGRLNNNYKKKCVWMSEYILHEYTLTGSNTFYSNCYRRQRWYNKLLTFILGMNKSISRFYLIISRRFLEYSIVFCIVTSIHLLHLFYFFIKIEWWNIILKLIFLNY